MSSRSVDVWMGIDWCCRLLRAPLLNWDFYRAARLCLSCRFYCETPPLPPPRLFLKDFWKTYVMIRLVVWTLNGCVYELISKISSNGWTVQTKSSVSVLADTSGQKWEQKKNGWEDLKIFVNRGGLPRMGCYRVTCLHFCQASNWFTFQRPTHPLFCFRFL